jgi:very-short-patch-repair endonuclease
MLKCLLCNFETDSQLKLSKHTSFYHKLKFPDYLIQIKYQGIHPLCKCGCNKETNYRPENGDFGEYLAGHHSKKEGHWGDWNNPKRVEAIKKTRKEKFASGEYDYIIESIKKGRKDPKLGNKISKGAKGISKPKPEGFGKGRKHSEETKEKMSKSFIKNILKSNGVATSNLEKTFINKFIKPLNIKYQRFFHNEHRKIYDLYLPEYKILIEIDGDFWHCNPKKYPNGPINEYQQVCIENDIFKNKWALENGYKLLRFWENDINNNSQYIIESLKKELYL